MARRKRKVDPRQCTILVVDEMQDFAPPKPTRVRSKLKDEELEVIRKAVMAGVAGPGARALAFRMRVSLAAVKRAMALFEPDLRAQRYTARTGKEDK